MATTGVSGLSERAPHHLSGGEKRMVSIAGVLAMRPSLIVYDEPSANLDIRSRRRLIEFLQSSEHTILVSSHDLELVLEVCERVVLMDAGKIVADGVPRSVMSDEDLMERHGLEKPHSLVPHGHSGRRA
jgi:cobalt/nickel transport system ATP-binding protein